MHTGSNYVLRCVSFAPSFFSTAYASFHDNLCFYIRDVIPLTEIYRVPLPLLENVHKQAQERERGKAPSEGSEDRGMFVLVIAYPVIQVISERYLSLYAGCCRGDR